MLNKMAQPHRFYRISAQIFPWTSLLTVALFAFGLYLSLWNSPPDYQQGETVRIMYIHVPSAWMALMIYLIMASCAFSSLVFKHRLADVICEALAPIGAAFTLICLTTGALWGKPMWGAWWVWDARLTAMLVLFFQYIGYIALVQSFDNKALATHMGAILLLIGTINIPIIKFSVEWWNTLHQPASFSITKGIGIHPQMMGPLFTMTAACLMLTLSLTCIRILTLKNIQKKKRL